MFNHYFLDGVKSEAVFHKFLSSNHGNDIVMVTDPPFGGLVEVLAAGVKWIMDTWKLENDKGKIVKSSRVHLKQRFISINCFVWMLCVGEGCEARTR